jgi:hypothetical protein
MARRARSTFGLLLALAGLAGPARASEGYSAQLAARLGIVNPPACGVCHAVAPDADPVAMTPFGQALRARGFTDASNLDAAFDRLAADRVDSDGDKASDADELGWGGDPNGFDGLRGEPAPEVRQGFCGVGAAPGNAARGRGGWALGPAALAFALARRRSAAARR